MIGVTVRFVLALLCLAAAVLLLRRANRARAAWRETETGVDRAETWWAETHGGPFDQDHGPAPADVEAYLGPRGPRTELRAPVPAQAEWVWGWVLIVLAALIASSAVAQLTSGTA